MTSLLSARQHKTSRTPSIEDLCRVGLSSYHTTPPLALQMTKNTSGSLGQRVPPYLVAIHFVRNLTSIVLVFKCSNALSAKGAAVVIARLVERVEPLHERGARPALRILVLVWPVRFVTLRFTAGFTDKLEWNGAAVLANDHFQDIAGVEVELTHSGSASARSRTPTRRSS